MICYTRKIGKNYALDISGLHFIRKFRDGVTFGEFSVNLHMYPADHNPRFNLIWVLLNFKLLEIDLYNVNHVEEAVDTIVVQINGKIRSRFQAQTEASDEDLRQRALAVIGFKVTVDKIVVIPHKLVNIIL